MIVNFFFFIFRELNPDIHKELPTVNEYRSRKNLRNLIQAYSTSSHRPSYERANTDYGLYVTHLCKYITRDISVQKIFEETGKCKHHLNKKNSLICFFFFFSNI